MNLLSLDWHYSKNYIDENDILNYKDDVSKIHKALHNKSEANKQYLGWLDLPNNYNNNELKKIKEVAKDIQNKCDVLVVLGVGGSFLGAKAILGMLNHSFYNLLPQNKRKAPKIFFAGNNLSSTYIVELIEILEDYDIAINVISKSGTTLETLIAFRFFREFMNEKYGQTEAAKRIIITTELENNPLRKLAKENGYNTFHIPKDIGGRFSVFTAVGLFPLAVANVEIDEILQGAAHATTMYNNENLETNISYIYAVIRNILYKQNKRIELLTYYEPNIKYLAEWWKQLFAESEGKDGQGLFPVSAEYTTDLHSIGQYIQDGHKDLFETVLYISKSNHEINIKKSYCNFDDLDQFIGKSLESINLNACKGVIKAHTDDFVPNIKINLPELSPFHVGYLLYFFKKACAVSGYLLGINPFNQPGVEKYKKEMFNLLKKRDIE